MGHSNSFRHLPGDRVMEASVTKSSKLFPVWHMCEVCEDILD
jgi:hypothetical protein